MKRRKDGLYQQELPRDITNGKRVVIYGKSKADLLRKARAYEDEAKQGKPFEAVADEWWEEAEPQLAETTRRGYRPAKARAVEQFGQTPIKTITPADIRAFLERCISQNHMADKTARTQLMVVNLICRYAVGNNYLPANPARDLTVPKGLEKHRRDIASPEDIKRVKASYGLPFGDFAYWALYTGCRRGELLALTWEDVDLEARTITISRSAYRSEAGTMAQKAPKTTAGVRVVPILDKLAEKIKPGKGPVFPGQNGFMTEWEEWKGWQEYRERTGISCTPHQLRHAYATMLFEAGVSESDAQELLGHAQITTTKDIYTHIREQRRAAIREELLSVDIQ